MGAFDLFEENIHLFFATYLTLLIDIFNHICYDICHVSLKNEPLHCFTKQK
jgi:hypothetical protein